MSTAFEITVDDVQAALFSKKQIDVNENEASDYYQNLNLDEIERSALFGNDIDEQTEFAYQSIVEQLEELDLI